jgi:DNA-binding MarR family transcriptional regulator
MDRHQGSRAKQLAGLLAGLDRTFRDEFKRSNGIPHHLTLAQFQVISLIAETGQCSQKAIAAYLGVTGPTVVRIIDALERKGLVVRTRDERDRRIVLVALTDRGTAVQHDCEAIHEQRLASVIERLPSEDAEGLLGSLSALLSAAQVSPRAN